MEDNKLTEFDQEKFELDILRFISKHTDTGGCFYHSDFLTDLRQIMPPTCSTNERKFLDRVKEIGELDTELGILRIGESSHLYEDDFKFNLQDLVKKKDE